MLFRLRYSRHPPDKDAPKGQRFYYVTLGAKVHGRDRLLQGSGEGNAQADGIHCGIDCDGGEVVIRREGDDAVVVYFGRTIRRLRMNESCDETDPAFALVPGKDDQSFRLTRADAGACPSLGAD